MTTVRVRSVDREPATVSFDDAREALESPDFVIVDVDDDDPDEAHWERGELAGLLDLRHEGLNWLGVPDEPARFELSADQTYVLVVPAVDGERVTHLHIVATARYLIIVHWHCEQLLDQFYRELRNQRDDTSLFLLLELLVDGIRDAATQVLLDLEEREDEILTQQHPDQLVALAAIRRRLVWLQRWFAPFGAAMSGGSARLARIELPRDQARQLRAFSQDVTAVAQSIHSAQDTAAHAIDSYSSLVATTQNKVINRLTTVSMVFLPLTFLTGFFGMNFAYLTDGIADPAPFWLLGIGLQATAIGTALFLLKRSGMLRSVADSAS